MNNFQILAFNIDFHCHSSFDRVNVCQALSASRVYWACNENFFIVLDTAKFRHYLYSFLQKFCDRPIL